jgi:ABC-type transport system involved in multi-copper enzyme maturation permease subunit
MIGRIWAIARNTFREAVRDRVLYNLVIFALLLIGGALVIGQVSVDVERQFLINLGLTGISLFGLAIAVLVGITLVSKEMDRRTLYTVLAARPVSRWEFLAGKWLGLTGTLTVNAALMAAGFFLALYWQAHAVVSMDVLAPVPLTAVLTAMYFIFLQFVLMTSLAMLFSTYSSPLMSSIFSVALFVIGSFGEDLRGLASVTQGAAHWLLEVVAWLTPNFAVLQIITQTAHGVGVSGQLIAINTVYVLLYSLAAMSLAAVIFERRDLK